jgi:CDP-diglyceride synthetase
MRSQEVELVVTLFIAGILLVIVRKLSKGKKKGDLRNYYMGKGQFFDVNSFSGNIYGVVLGLLVCCLGWFLDDIGRLIWHAFGSELIVSPEKEAWHRIVSATLGGVLIVSATIRLIFLIGARRRKVRDDEIEQLRRLHDSRSA